MAGQGKLNMVDGETVIETGRDPSCRVSSLLSWASWGCEWSWCGQQSWSSYLPMESPMWRTGSVVGD